MVSQSGAYDKAPKGKPDAWKFQCKNRNLRVPDASRASTRSEHSTPCFPFFPLALMENR